MKQNRNMSLILEGLHEAKSPDSLPQFKAKNSLDRFMSDASFAIERSFSKELTDSLGRCQIIMSAGNKLPSKEINNLEISLAYDASKDKTLALSLAMKEFDKLLSIAHETATCSARPGYILLNRNNIAGTLKALESVYGVKLDQYFTKTSLKNI